MSRTIGVASDFYRLRVMTVDTTDAVDFEWREDILYREHPPGAEIVDDQAYTVEAVLLDDDDIAFPMKTFADPAEARGWLDERESELGEMTKSEFEGAYFPEGWS